MSTRDWLLDDSPHSRWQANADEYGWTLKEFLENVCITQPAEVAETEKKLAPRKVRVF